MGNQPKALIKDQLTAKAKLAAQLIDTPGLIFFAETLSGKREEYLEKGTLSHLRELILANPQEYLNKQFGTDDSRVSNEERAYLQKTLEELRDLMDEYDKAPAGTVVGRIDPAVIKMRSQRPRGRR
jgi:hypothetical protein